MKEKITVIVPAYNVEQYIGRCLESILCQTYTNLEIIVFDDGSTDMTGAIIDEYAKKDERIIPVHQDNSGLVAVREKGIAMACGDFVTFVDGDDAVEADMYARLLKNALESGADISHCGLCVMELDGRRVPHYGTGIKLINSSLEALKDLLEGEKFDASLCNKLYRREIMPDSCLDMSIQSNEDMLRNFVLFGRAKKVVFEDFCGYQYWSRENSMSNDSKLMKRNSQLMRARKLILDNSSKEIYPSAMRLWLTTFVGFINQNFKSKDPEIKALCKKSREILKKEKKNLVYLIRRQQIAAKLIIYAPFLHRLVYTIYDRRR